MIAEIGDMKLRRSFRLALDISVFAVAVATIILGINETTVDALDRMGSNYWLAWCAIISGIATILLILPRHRRG